jgi:hypothetical protein
MHITTNVVNSNLIHGEVFSMQHNAMKFVSDLRQVGGFLRCTAVSSANKTDHHDITDILLKVALNTITLARKGLCGHVCIVFIAIYVLCVQ